MESWVQIYSIVKETYLLFLPVNMCKLWGFSLSYDCITNLQMEWNYSHKKQSFSYFSRVINKGRPM